MSRAATPVLALALLGAGCSSTDPLTRAGLWRPAGVNRADLAIMAADPTDLRRGHGTILADGQLAGAAVFRLRHDQVKPLPQSGLAEVHMQGDTAAAALPSAGAPAVAP